MEARTGGYKYAHLRMTYHICSASSLSIALPTNNITKTFGIDTYSEGLIGNARQVIPFADIKALFLVQGCNVPCPVS